MMYAKVDEVYNNIKMAIDKLSDAASIHPYTMFPINKYCNPLSCLPLPGKTGMKDLLDFFFFFSSSNYLKSMDVASFVYICVHYLLCVKKI